MNTVKSRQVLLAALTLAITACAAHAPKPAPTVDPVAQELAASAQSIQASLTQLADAEQYDKFGRKPGSSDLTPSVPGLDAEVTLPWNGPLEQVVTKLAAMGGYAVEFSGKPPVMPILVSLNGSPARIVQQLRTIGLQAGTRAEIVIDPTPSKQRIGVIYANTGL